MKRNKKIVTVMSDPVGSAMMSASGLYAAEAKPAAGSAGPHGAADPGTGISL